MDKWAVNVLYKWGLIENIFVGSGKVSKNKEYQRKNK